jgi:hypothetical protein
VDVHDKVSLLVRLARRCPDESNVLLTWAEELLQGTGQVGQHQGIEGAPDVAFPLSIFIVAKGRRIDGVLYKDCRVQVDGRSYRSPSGAASAELGYLENGWRVWRFQDPEGKIQAIDLLRRQRLV